MMLINLKKWIGVIFVVIMGLVFPLAALAGGEGEFLDTALSRVEILSGLTRAELDILKPAARLFHGKKGEQVIRQGSLMGRMLVVLDGQVEVRIDGKSFVSFSGQVLLGEIEFLDGHPATADVVLLKDADYISLDTEKLKGIMDAHPRIGYVLLREIAGIEAHRLRNTSTR
jgi:CRP-like cAMP-binding protein